MSALLVFLGGGLGSAARYGVGLLATRLLGNTYPFGTFAINVAGSFAMGVVAGFFALRSGLSPTLQLLLATGVIGGFTTFSTFSLEAALLVERGQIAAALVYLLSSVILGLGALFCGLSLARALA